jgi:molybdopterin/thiamine biosynthesis adenylyltransferase
VDLLQALHFLRAWDSVKPETIERCFRKAGFVIDDEIINILPEIEGHDEVLNNIWGILKERGETEGELSDYLTVDQKLVTYGALTIGEIVEICSTKEAEEVEDNSNSDTDVVEEELPTVSTREASEALKILQRYVDRSGNQTVQKACDTIDDFISEELLKNLKQMKIVDYFR